jgi:hypothetical protein
MIDKKSFGQNKISFIKSSYRFKAGITAIAPFFTATQAKSRKKYVEQPFSEVIFHNNLDLYSNKTSAKIIYAF